LHNKRLLKRILALLAFVSLVGAYIYGIVTEEKFYQKELESAFPEMEIINSKGTDPICYQAKFPEGAYFVLIKKAMGWGGPAIVASKVDTAGNLVQVKVIDHKETPAFFARLEKEQYFDQFGGKHISDKFELGNDLNAISGATVSSKGFNRAIRESSHFLANESFSLSISDEKESVKLNQSGYIVIILIMIAFFASIFKFRKAKIIVQLSSVFILGFLLNCSLSISNFGAMFMGFFPNPASNIMWYIMMFSVVLMIIILGKPTYCIWLCPFGAIQDLLNKISGISLPIHPLMKKFAKWSSGFLTWFSLFVIFISRNPSVGSYEPFAALFGFKGIGLVWVVLPAMIFSSFFIKRMWCRYFCPVGYLIIGGCKQRNQISKQIKPFYEKVQHKIFIKQPNNTY
jgi:Na+-translocating ferredoxin:NAD+ oxidoreductase RnfG subunit